MNNSFNFSSFSRQSPKGILVIYINLIYRVVKTTWLLLFFVVKDFSKVSDKVGANYVYLGIIVLLTFLLIRAYLIYKNFQFKITDEYFILEQGILKKTNTSIPLHRIQNINFKQNIVQQIIAVFEVNIETAGSSKAEISIKALSLLKAEALKEIISKKVNYNDDLILKDKEKPLLRIGFLELLKVSLTENHLQNLFLFFAILVGFFQQLEQITGNLLEFTSLDGFIAESTNTFSASILFATVLLLTLGITALLSSIVKVFLVHFNLIAYLKDDAFEINQGLFIKKSIVLKKQKVQNIKVSTNPLKRFIGIYFITFKQAISGKINVKKNKLIRIVGCRKEQVEIIKSSLFDIVELENQEKKYPDAYYKRRMLVCSLLFLVALYLFFYIGSQQVEVLYSAVVVFPLVVFLILKKVKKRFYKITDSMLLVGKGLLETHHTYFEIFKVQNIKMKQTIFQKRSNVADLILQTASGKINIPCLNYDDAVKIYNHTLYKVETSETSWM